MSYYSVLKYDAKVSIKPELLKWNKHGFKQRGNNANKNKCGAYTGWQGYEIAAFPPCKS